MGLRNITTDDIAAALVYVLLFANDLNAAPTTGGCGLHDVHVLEVVDLTVQLKAFIVLRKYVRCRSYVVGLPILAFHALDVAPHLVLAPDGPGACKMIYFLIAVKVFYSSRFE